MKLRDIRERASLTQCDVAKALGVPQSSISQWENGDYYPQAAKIHKLAKLYGVTEGDVIAAISEVRVERENSA